MTVTLEPEALAGLSADDEAASGSALVADRFEQLRDEVSAHLDDRFEGFSWNGSPYLGPSEPATSEYVWLGLAHETYRSLRRPSGGLQIEFGVDADTARGFFGRSVLCGLYLGPWAGEPETGDIAERLRAESAAVAAFLEANPEYVLVTGTDTWTAPSAEVIEARADELVEGFTVTRDLTFSDLSAREDVTDLVTTTIRDVRPLYLTLAGVDDAVPPSGTRAGGGRGEDAAGDEADAGSADHDSDGVRFPAAGSSAADGFAVSPTVDSIASFSSILDADDVDHSIELLTGRGADRDEALRYIRQYAVDMEREDGFYAIQGVGPTTGYLLAAEGIDSLRALSSAPREAVVGIDGLSETRLAGIWEAASDLGDAPVASSTDESEASNATSDRTTETAEENSADETEAETDAAVEMKTKDGLAAGTHDGRKVVANPLSEYYEAFRSVRSVLSTVMQLRGTDFDPDDLTDPCVQYLVLLDTCVGQGHPDPNFPGYGTQHRNRLPFRTTDYRQVFGDGDWITEYRAIDVEPYRDETREWLAANTPISKPERHVRPVAPGEGRPLPEIVETVEDLRYALSLLGQFPAYPALPTERGATDRTVPVAELYTELFGDSEDTRLLDPATLSGPGQRSGDPISGPVAEATPTSEAETASFLLDYGKLTHLFQRIEPPASAAADQSVPVFGLDWYEPNSGSFSALQNLAKHGEDEPISAFRSRLQDMIHRRFLRDRWKYDYLTVFPSHEAGMLSPQLVELARDGVVETSIVYAPLLERTETRPRQREQSREGRLDVAADPGATLRARASLDDATVILFDDICTTGSSLLAGAHLLREAGASRVIGLTLGFTPGDSGTSVREIKKADAVVSDVVAGVE